MFKLEDIKVGEYERNTKLNEAYLAGDTRFTVEDIYVAPEVKQDYPVCQTETSKPNEFTIYMGKTKLGVTIDENLYKDIQKVADDLYKKCKEMAKKDLADFIKSNKTVKFSDAEKDKIMNRYVSRCMSRIADKFYY